MSKTTPCEELGYREGDLFIICRDKPYGSAQDTNDPVGGDLVKLIKDDGTGLPLFEVVLSSNPEVERAKRERSWCLYINYGGRLGDQPEDVVKLEDQDHGSG